MNKTKIFCKTVAIIIIVLMFVWFWQYNNQILNLNVFGKEFSKPLSVYSGYIFLIGFLTSVIASMGTMKSNELKAKEYEKKLNSTSIDSSKDKSKIEALERKIATLEKALETKLEDK